MLNKMSLMLAATAVALSCGAASAAHYDRHDHGRSNTVLTVGFGDIAFGYNDGYWDNSHRWHRWNSTRDFHNYRDHGNNYHRWNHNRDHDNGWQRH